MMKKTRSGVRNRIAGFHFAALMALLPAATVSAASYDSVVNGNYTNGATWGTAGYPNLTGPDSAFITNAVDFNGGYVTGDFTVRGGSVLTIGDGGSWTQILSGSWIRIADQNSIGTVNINDGVFAPGTANNLQVGGFTTGARGILNVGDGSGAAGTAVLNMAGKGLSLGRDSGTTGEVTIASDGAVWNASNVRLGEAYDGSGSGGVGVLTLLNGGVATNASGRTYLGATVAGSSGTLNVGDNSVYVHSAADEFWIGGRGTGRLNITGSGQVILSDTGARNHHLAVFNGTGSMVVADSGIFTNASTGNFTLGGVGAGSGVGTIVVSNQGKVMMPNTPFQVGSSSAGGGKGFVYLYDDAQLLVNRGWIGHNASVTGAVVMAGNSRFNVQGGGFFVIGEFGQGSLTIGENAAMNVTLNSGTANFAIGAQNGGAGATSGRGVVTLADNAVLTNNAATALALNPNTLGTISLGGLSRWHANQATFIGNASTGILNIADGAQYIASGVVTGAVAPGAVGRLNITGGTWRQQNGAGLAGGAGDFRINLGGGRILAGASFTINAAAPIELTGIGGAGTLDASNSVISVQSVVSGGALVVTGLYANSTGRVGLMAANTYTGGTTIAGGTLTITNDAALGAAPAAPQAGNLTIDGGILANMRADYSAGEDVTLDTNRGITLGAAGGTFRTGYGRLLVVNGVIAGEGKLLKTDGNAGAGALVLNAANTFTNNTEWANIGVGRGIIRLGHTHALQNSTVAMPDAGDATLDLNNLDNAVLGGLAGGGASGGNVAIPGGKTLQVGNNGQSTAYGGVLSGGTLVKLGAGTLTLNGHNTHSGDTVVSNGTLAVGATGSISNTPLIQLAGAGTALDVSAVPAFHLVNGQQLKGNGQVLGSVALDAGSQLTPGNSIGTMNVSGGLILTGGVLLNFELGATNDSDRVVVGGQLDLGGIQWADFSFIPGAGFGPGVYTLISAGSLSGSLGASTGGPVDSYPAALAADTAGGNLLLTVIPEPASVGLVLLAGVAFAVRRRVFRKPA